MRKGKLGRVAFALLLSVTLIGANISFVYAEEESSSSSDSGSSSSGSSSSSSGSSSSSSDSGKSSSGSSSSSSDSGKSSSGSSSSSSDSGKSSSGSSSSSSDSGKSSSGSSSSSSDSGKSSSDSNSSSSDSGKSSSDSNSSSSDSGSSSSDSNSSSSDSGSSSSDSNSSSSDSGEKAPAEGEGAEDKASAEDGDTVETAETEETLEEGLETTETEETLEEGLETTETEETSEEASEALFTNKDGEEVDPSSLVGTDYTTIAETYDGEVNVIKQYAVSDEYGANMIMESYIDENGNLVMVISQGADIALMSIEEEEGSKKSSSSAPAVDGSFSGWDDIPVTYEYNWDNSQNCWNWGVWVDGQKYTSEPGSYNTDVRHAMQMYSDGENVYLNITFAREFSTGQVANGNDYQFWIDGQMAAYQVEWSDGSQLANSNAAPGTYQVDVRHRDSSWSYVLTDGAVAYYHVNEGNLNNKLEMKIPLSEFQKQNGNINLDNYNMIQFFTPNLMYNKISAAGSPTGAVPFAVAAFLVVPAGYVWLKERENKGVSFA